MRELREVVCARCPMSFGLHDAFIVAKARTKQDVYCPNGHKCSVETLACAIEEARWRIPDDMRPQQ